MSKITTPETLYTMYLAKSINTADVQCGGSAPFWQVREQCRMNSGEYDPVHISGDDPLRFLHVSQDDPNKVAYTKNAEKGAQDIQTRTTLSAYKAKFGLNNSVTPIPAPAEQPAPPGIISLVRDYFNALDALRAVLW